MGKFTIKTGSDGQFYFNLHANNGEKILSSEAYTTRDNCLNGILSVKANAANSERYERKTANDGSYFFVLKAANNQVIGKSEMYTSGSSRDSGISAVKANAPGAEVTG